jgi:GntR family transcriptional regulator
MIEAMPLHAPNSTASCFGGCVFKPGGARDLAAVLGVNTNTVLRALPQLRDEGLLEFHRGRGITVTGTPQHGAVVAQATDLIRFARQHGYRLDELVRLIENIG